jgi:hypothetical protein
METTAFHYPFDKVPVREKMTDEKFNEKWGDVNVDDLPDEKFEEFKNDCFLLYETNGFSKTFHSPYDDEGEHNGKPFKVVRRATAEECDIEAMPIWVVEFEGESEPCYCYPEEICVAEENNPAVQH